MTIYFYNQTLVGNHMVSYQSKTNVEFTKYDTEHKNNIITKLSNRKERRESNIRTPLSEACEDVIKLLVSTRKPHSISSLARESKLHRKTVEKCINLFEVLEYWLENYRITLDNIDNKRIIGIERRMGLLSYPEDVQKLLLRIKHFPEPSAETCRVMNMYLRNAVSPENSIQLEENETIKKLLKLGRIKKSDSGWYLSKEGITIAKGAFKVFPEYPYKKEN